MAKVKSMEDRIIEAMRRTWDIIAEDYLRDDTGKPGYNMHLTGEDVGLAASDYLEIYGNDIDATRHFRKMESAERMAVINKAFSNKVYGW